ncbi:MAG: BlaR1 antirepressor sensor-transducer peptidase, partial [Psychroflexus sp.]|nr:BlaR1 antirepressor sensor-transducer peptidase [Psychroflexus sp.]
MELLIYLSKASLLLFLFWAFYKLLLERESYHLFKRIYLYCGIGFSAILPLIHYTTYTTLHLPKQENFISAGTQDQPIINTSLIERILGYATEHHLFEIIYFSISTVFLCYFAFSFYKILRFLKQAKKEKKNGIYYIQTEMDTAFSFLNYIVYNPQMYSEKELIFVLKHEQAHVECKHSFDALLAMLYRSFFWFNPFAWLYKQAITQNIEFEADPKAVTQTTSKDYQYS